MKAREYIEHKFLPWILFLDPRDTINHFNHEKENYLCELYNHISEAFKSLERYELYMFRVQMQKQMLPIGMANIIICNLPTVKYPNEARAIYIVYNEDTLIYYVVAYLLNGNYELIKETKGSKESIAVLDYDAQKIFEAIQNNLME